MNKLKVLYKSFHQIVFNKTLLRAVFLLFLWKALVLKPYVRPSVLLTFCIVLYSLLWSKAMNRVKLTRRWLAGLVFLEGFLIPLCGNCSMSVWWSDYSFLHVVIIPICSNYSVWLGNFLVLNVMIIPFYVGVSLLLLNLNGNTHYNLLDYMELRKKREQMRKNIEQMLLR